MHGSHVTQYPLTCITSHEQGLFVQQDLDVGASGAIILEDKKLVITGGKQGPLYLANIDNLGGYDPSANNTNVYEVRTP